MAIQMIEDGTHIAEKAHRFESALAAVNARIVFLAGFVGARLDADGEVQHILDRDTQAYRQVAAHLAAHHGGHGNHVAHRAWEELRGLMVLRCALVTRALSALGLGLTHQITSEVERGLERKGIRPGADGFDLHLQMERLVGNLAPPASPILLPELVRSS
jgi:hypothetical protein